MPPDGPRSLDRSTSRRGRLPVQRGIFLAHLMFRLRDAARMVLDASLGRGPKNLSETSTIPREAKLIVVRTKAASQEKDQEEWVTSQKPA